MAELISILMPVRNAEKFLEQCLSSIAQQRYIHWELIAVDDGSSDNSAKIIADMAKLDSRIQLYRQSALGIIPALQLAYSKSSGVLISRMDADDHMHPEKLKELRDGWLSAGKGYLIVGKVAYFREGGLGEGYEKYAHWLNSIGVKKTRWEQLFKECVIPSPCWLVHREDFEKAGAFNSEIYPEDYDLCFRFYKSGLATFYAEKAIHFWRDYQERSSRNDPNYADNNFLEIKMKYFLELCHDPSRDLVVWGAGNKGKGIAKKLIGHNIDFLWITNNIQKIGNNIYGKILEQDYNEKSDFRNKQLLIAFAGEEEQLAVKKLLNSKNLKAGEDYFFFA